MSNIIKVPFPEFLDAITALATSPGAIDSEVVISEETVRGLYLLSVLIPETPTQRYYKGVIIKWLTQLQNETTDL